MGQGTPPPPETPRLPGGRAPGGTQPRLDKVDTRCLPGGLPGPKATPEETRAQGRETSFFQGMRREHWDREASLGGLWEGAGA